MTPLVPLSTAPPPCHTSPPSPSPSPSTARHRTSTDPTTPSLPLHFPPSPSRPPHVPHTSLPSPLPSRHGAPPLSHRILPRLALLFLTVLLFLTYAALHHPTPWRASHSLIGSPRHDWPPHPLDPSSLPGPHSPPVRGCLDPERESRFPREKAALLILARDSDIDALLPTIENFEAKFNNRFKYPYVFLNDVAFSASFVLRIRKLLGDGDGAGRVEFGTIDEGDWSIPSWIDEGDARDAFARMGNDGVQYADQESYHHMCRYYSGLFANHPLLEKYDWYWRLEPGVRYFCDITYDPFRFLAQRNMVYGFVITIVETPNTIPTLFRTMLQWRDQHLGKGNRSDLWEFFLKPQQTGEQYNLCHFWTNMEIGSLRFLRSEPYQSLFKHLDRAGGFYLERWGDAPIRSLALGLLADFDKVHYFEDLAYKHDWFVHCPAPGSGVGCNCDCPALGGPGNVDIDNDWHYSCLPRWRQLDAAW